LYRKSPNYKFSYGKAYEHLSTLNIASFWRSGYSNIKIFNNAGNQKFEWYKNAHRNTGWGKI